MNYIIGSYTKVSKGGIYNLNLNSKKLSLLKEEENPTYLDFNKNFIVSTFGNNSSGGICLFDNNFNLLDKTNCFNCPPCYISLYNNFVFSCNYHEGKLVIYKIENQRLSFIKNFSISKGKFHFCRVFNKNLFLVDLENSSITSFSLEDFSLIDSITLNKSFGLRHLDFKGNYIYGISEKTNTLFTLTFINNKFKLLNTTLITTPLKTLEGCTIKIVKDLIYTSERKFNTFSIFKINKNGEVTKSQNFSHHKIQNSRDFEIDFKNNLLLSANLISNEISIFTLTPKGLIDKYMGSYTVTTPTFIKKLN